MKVASTSFEHALSRFATPTSIVTFKGRAKFERDYFPIFINPNYDKDTVKFYHHMPVKELKEILSEDVFKGYNKIAIMRNPFDRIISAFFWARYFNPDNPSSLNKPPELPLEEMRLHFQEWIFSDSERNHYNNDDIYKIDNNYEIDTFIRYEHLEHDIKQLENQNPMLENLWNIFSRMKAKSEYRPKEATVEFMFKGFPSGIDLICSTCVGEIEKFEYTIPNT